MSRLGMVVRCERCGRTVEKMRRGMPYKFCSRACSVVPSERRFFRNVAKGESCWLWTGKKNDGGYGELQVNKKIIKAHRFSFILHGGVVQNGHEVCHSCDNPSCVNPAHLFSGTHSDNMRDMARKGRGYWPDTRGERHGASKLTSADVIAIRAATGPQSAVAARFYISQTTVSQIRLRKRWAHIQ